MNTSRLKVVVNSIQGKISSMLGYFFAVGLFVGLVTNAEDMLQNPDDAWVMAILFILGALGIAKGFQIKRRIKRFRRYVFLLSAKGMSSIDALAASTGKAADFVKKDLQKMIDKKFFVRAMIDDASNELIIGSTGGQSIPQTPVRVAACQNCGAKMKAAAGQIAECAYCGSFIIEEA